MDAPASDRPAGPARLVFDELRALRRAGERVIRLEGCDGALAALAVARLCEDLSTGAGRSGPVVVVVRDDDGAARLHRDLDFFLGAHGGAGQSYGSTYGAPGTAGHREDPAAPPRVMTLPVPPESPWADVTPDRRAIMGRLSTLFRLTQAGDPALCGQVLLTSVTSLARRVLPRQTLAALCDILQAEQEIDRDRTVALLTRAGYTRMPVCEDPGTFAVRGGVLDLFPPLYRFPVRLQLYGDLIEEMRFYDPGSQRTLRKAEELYIHPVRETILTPGNRLRERLLQAGDLASHPSARTRQYQDQIEAGEDFFGIEALVPAMHERLAPVFSYLPEDTTFFLLQPQLLEDALLDELIDADRSYDLRLSERRLSFPPADFYLNTEELQAGLAAAGARRVEVPGTGLVEGGELQLLEGEADDGDAEGAADDDAAAAHAPSPADATPGPAPPTLRFLAEDHRPLSQALQRTRADKHEHLLKPLVSRLRGQLDEGVRTVIVCSSLQHAERLQGLLKGYGLKTALHRPGIAGLVSEGPGDGGPHGFDVLELRSVGLGGSSGPVELRVGPLGRGFDLPLDRVSLYAEAEIFGEKAARRPAKAQKKPQLGDFKDLAEGAYVVHKLHGVGVYKGLAKLPVRGAPVDFVHIAYEGGNLYLPVWRLSEVSRYVGAEGLTPKVDRLGGETWQKTRGKVSREVRQMAEELLQLYAARQAQPGHAFQLDEGAEGLFREFEATFPFEETPDQQKAIDDVLEDLELGRPMDRLVCGDVGYGKTEVAMRAAMKVALAGKQVAVLAPTTVLVEQHLQTFTARFAGMPVNVSSLSRFRGRQEQLQVIKGLAAGTIDIVVGTHRLLSADVRFKDLGLIIIDEEQRFGVAHKERLRKLRTQVDTLTLSATPIPRTLHMAMSGLREISIITTAPADRLAIRTMVARESDDLIRDGIKKELARGGQVFFVHNRVETIGKWQRRLHELMPEVKVLMGHGQMSAEELERVMLDFVEGRADVLLCTTIIESGLDIPRANTMFVDRADTFGLSQLYQLRGRIGRSRERAFCYLLVPAEGSLTPEAKQRLAVLQRFSELGAGFNIASHDLEIRGAGDLLGDRQHGTIAAVGFDMYTQMLQDAIAELQGQPIVQERDLELSFDLPGFIPDTYLPDTGQRLEFYRRLSNATSEDEVGEIYSEIRDRYGDPPEEVEILCGIMIVRGLGRRLGATALELTEVRLGLALGDDTVLRPDLVMRLVSAKKSPWKLTPDMRLVRTWQGEEEKRARLKLARGLLADLLAGAAGG